MAMILLDLPTSARLDYIRRAVRMPSFATSRLRVTKNESGWPPMDDIFSINASGTNVLFGPDHRRMWFTAVESDTVVVQRFIGHSELKGNYQGIAALRNKSLQTEISSMAAELCGARPRVLWLQSGYHDLVQAKDRRCSKRHPCRLALTDKLRQNYQHAFQWAGTLAPTRVWLSRHSTNEMNVSSLEEWVQTQGLPTTGWMYADHRKAWACSGIDEHELPHHTGAIQYGFFNRRYCCAYLSSLRTWLAISLTSKSVEGAHQALGKDEETQRTFVERLESHLQWQRNQLKEDSRNHRFLVYRPGNRWLVCASGPVRRYAAHNRKLPGCMSARQQYLGSRPAPYTGHWDDAIANVMSGTFTNYSRVDAITGLGNIMSGLISVAAVAMLSRRILLVENWTSAAHSLEWPMTQLLLHTSGFEDSLERAQSSGSRLDSFMAEDDFSIANHLCSVNLRNNPEARVWRIVSDQYFLPLLFLNPHHKRDLAAASSLSSSGNGRQHTSSPVWGPALEFLLRPRRALVGAAHSFEETNLRPDGAKVLAIHMRCVVSDGRCAGRNLYLAAECARKRAIAQNATRVFVAAMHHSHRAMIAGHLNGTAQVFWSGEAVGAQHQTDSHEDKRLTDLLLLARADELLLTTHSSFGYVARGLAAGKRAVFYNTCEDLPSRATEPGLMIAKSVLGRSSKCRDLLKQAKETRESTIASVLSSAIFGSAL